MDGCPISFETQIPLQLNPEFDSGVWENQAGATNVTLMFDATMDTTVLPSPGSFELELDGVIRAIDSFAWSASNVLVVTSVVGIPAVDPVKITLLAEDDNLHALSGRNVLPFGPVAIPEV